MERVHVLDQSYRANEFVLGTLETVGREEVAAHGGRVEIVPTVEGFSTTHIVKKLTSTLVSA